MKVVFIGLSITSAWGNGHATNYRGLVRELSARGHEVLFCERDMPWNAAHRDLPEPPWGRTSQYRSLEELTAKHCEDVAAADLVVVGSLVPEGAAVCEWALKRGGGSVAFYDLDTPYTLDSLRNGECEYLSTELVAQFDLYLSSTGGPILEALEEEFGAQHAIAFHCLVDSEAYRPVAVETRWDLGYLGNYRADRHPVLERLLIEPARRAPHLRFAVAGPRYPAEIDWPDNVERIGFVAPADHPSFYAAQRFSLNASRPEIRAAGWSPSARLFESAACEVPVISDRWEGLGEIFTVDEEILIADSGADILNYLTEIGEDERAAIGGRARQRTLADHTAERRCELLEEEGIGLVRTR